jgi:hypothetical protein
MNVGVGVSTASAPNEGEKKDVGRIKKQLPRIIANKAMAILSADL